MKTLSQIPLKNYVEIALYAILAIAAQILAFIAR